MARITSVKPHRRPVYHPYTISMLRGPKRKGHAITKPNTSKSSSRHDRRMTNIRMARRQIRLEARRENRSIDWYAKQMDGKGKAIWEDIENSKKTTREFQETVKEIIELWMGVGGDIRDAAVTFGDLEDVGFDVDTILNSTPEAPAYNFGQNVMDVDPPEAPTNLAVDVTGVLTHEISWTNPMDGDLYLIEIWVSKDGSGRDSATKRAAITVAGRQGQDEEYLNIGIDASKDYYYWIRAIDYAGNPSVWNPGTDGEVINSSSNTNMADLMNALDGAISNEHIDDAAGIVESKLALNYATHDNSSDHSHSNKTELDLVTDGDHDARTDNPHGVASSQLVTGTPQSGTYTFGGGSTGDVASMTFENGILTVVTTVP